ncbi:hypothetical protein [Terriglobus aquaticus]|uniref:hypothetical protein n=1 Tax=Terriglobus aquaticus TaxID=940139 RepID=UPI0021DF6BB9|nr:hypothetical protein [Terriglobus aquaticus]
MRWQIRIALWAVGIVVGSFVLDQLIWTLSGSPVRQVEVRVLTTMELKNHKEDYGTPNTQVIACEASLLPFPGSGGWSRPCWWLQRHSEVIRRY